MRTPMRRIYFVKGIYVYLTVYTIRVHNKTTLVLPHLVVLIANKISLLLQTLKKNVETEEANTEQTKKAHETTVLNEKKTLNTLRKKEEKVRVKVGEMLRALDEATHMYKENEKQLLQQKRLKDNAMKAQQEATNTINRLKDDLEKVYTAGDKISEEDMQLSQDIMHLKALLKTQRQKKDEMKQHLHDVQEQRKLAEKEVEEQQRNLEILRLESEMLYADLKGDL